MKCSNDNWHWNASKKWDGLTDGQTARCEGKASAEMSVADSWCIRMTI